MPESTMKDIIGAIKTLLVANSGVGKTLSKIKQVKRGVLPHKYILPVISIMPSFERITSRRSGRQVIIERGIDIFIIDKDHRGRKGIQELQTLASQTREILIDNYLLNAGGTALTSNAEFDNILYSEDEADKSLFHTAQITIVYRSDEQLPITTSRSSITNNPTVRTISSAIYDDLYAVRTTTLSGIRKFFNDEWGPFDSKLPALVVSPQGTNVESEYAGQDLLNHTIAVDILSSIRSQSDAELLKILDFVEAAKDVLQTDVRLEGNTLWSFIDDITFDTGVDNNDFVYQATITMTATSKDNTASYLV